ncbi:hypothetical protein EJB05_33543, partial [Eragrostis curvula]
MAPGRTPRKELHQEGFEPNYEDAIRQKKLATIQSKFAGRIGGSRFLSFVSASTRSKAAIDKASQVYEGKGRSGRRCKREVAPDRQVHGTRITWQRTREMANSNDSTQKGALEDENQAQYEGTRTQERGTQEDQRQVQEERTQVTSTQAEGRPEDESQAKDEGTRPILLAEEVTSTQEEGTPEDESQSKDEGTRPILLAEEVTSTQEEGTPEDESQAQDEGTPPILLAEEVTSTQEEGTPEDESQVQDEGTRPILLAEEVISTQEVGTPENQRQVQEEEVTSTQEEGTPEDQGQVQEDEIFHRPPARPRAGAELHRINGAIESKLAIRIDEGMKRPVIPIQAAKFATEGGMVLRQHIPVLPSWKEYKMDPSYGNFWLDTTNKTVKDACVDMLKSGTRQLRYRLKKKYFDGVPASEVMVTSPVSSMTDEQWGKLVKMWSSPKHKEICLLNQHNREKVQFNHRTGSRCYIAQHHALRDKYKDEDPTPVGTVQRVTFITKNRFH